MILLTETVELPGSEVGRDERVGWIEERIEL
jgi:hypothetical protein